MSTGQDTPTCYTPQLIAFARVGVAFAQLVERGAEPSVYIAGLLQTLSRLYSAMISLPSYFYDPQEDFIEEYITEESYERVRQRAEQILGERDVFLTTISQDMAYSDTPVARHISECIADIYQHVGNLLGIIKEQNEVALPAAIGRCRLYWQEHWGLALIASLGALHTLFVEQAETTDPFEDLEPEVPEDLL